MRVRGEIGEDVMGIYPLQDGERVLWSGRPEHPKRWFAEHLVLLLSIAVGVTALVLMGTFDPDFPIEFLYLSMIPLAVVASRTQLQGLRARAFAATYVVTDLRVIFVMQWPTGAEFRWVWHHRLPPARTKTDERGVGTITFGTSPWTRWTLANKPQSGAWAPFAPDLHAIADAERVAELIRQAQRAPLPH
jgi:hypothetical protein